MRGRSPANSIPVRTNKVRARWALGMDRNSHVREKDQFWESSPMPEPVSCHRRHGTGAAADSLVLGHGGDGQAVVFVHPNAGMD